ncbi:MAG: carboxypeptidase-like regulatory domain-containing protein [Aureispira sp.]|nr:carboxypeptidase-like regulatory domain-containing protein [Aureispira sp.]
MTTIRYFLVLMLIATVSLVNAQDYGDIVEVSGIVVTKGPYGKYQPIPLATVLVKDANRGVYANYEGMFTIVVKKGQTLKFSAVGFGTKEVVVPENAEGLHFSLTVDLEVADVNIDEVIVFPWPDRNNLVAEFLAMEPTLAMQLEDIASDNLGQDKMIAIAEATDMDGSETSKFYLRQQSREFSYQGQQAPMPIFNLASWYKFIKDAQKKKKEKEKDKFSKALESEGTSVGGDK